VTTLFISDLHLADTRPGVTRLFLDFLRGPARNADALYILGDLFEYWAGDDDLDEPLNRAVASALGKLADDRVKTFFMAGNRDFLIGDDFAQRSGLAQLDDSTVIDLDGTPTLLMHGDTLCTDDLAYQQFRDTVRAPAYIAQFLAQSLAARKAQIAAIRERSEADKETKTAQIMDVNRDAVVAAFRRHAAARLIHGHTHRPADHRYEIDGRPCTRIVLADWHDERGEYLRCDGGTCLRVAIHA
jgi:UDP-2,3-diacylglucosamine hydrolase